MAVIKYPVPGLSQDELLEIYRNRKSKGLIHMSKKEWLKKYGGSKTK